MESSGNSENQRAGGRPGADFILAIESVGELYTGLAPRLSTDGLYIETDQPVPPDVEVGFTVTLPDGVVVIRGVGRVMWVRPPESAGDPTGLAIRFSDVDPDARETLDAVIDAHLASGGILFDLDGGELGGETFPTDSLDTTITDSHGPRWIREVDGQAATASSSDAEKATDAGELQVGELQFEEAISGFSGGQETGAAADDRFLDDAIAAAVGLTTENNHRGGGPFQAGSDTTPPSAAPEHVIPDVLDQWRRELEIAGQGPLPTAPATEPPDDAKAWESLLPFEPDKDADLGPPAPWTAPERTTTSARWDGDDDPRPGRWWMIAMAVMAVVVVGVALAIWFREGSENATTPPPQVTVVEEVAVAPLDEALESAADPEVRSDLESARDPLPEPVPSEPAPTASIVESITWQANAGQTRVVIRANEVLQPGAVDAIRLEDPPRVLVRVRGIDEPFTPHRFEVTSPEITAIRVGYHPELRPVAVYVVLDLASDEVLSDGALSVTRNQAVVTVRTGS